MAGLGRLLHVGRRGGYGGKQRRVFMHGLGLTPDFLALPTGSAAPVGTGTPLSDLGFHTGFPVKGTRAPGEVASSGAGQGKCSMSLKHFVVLESEEVLKNKNKTEDESASEGTRVSWLSPQLPQLEQ